MRGETKGKILEIVNFWCLWLANRYGHHQASETEKETDRNSQPERERYIYIYTEREREQVLQSCKLKIIR